MTLSTSSHPLGFYTSYTPGCGGTLDQLQERYGSRLEGISRLGKQMLRATLAAYVVMRPIWAEEGNSISCADSCIVGAGGDDYNIWEQDPEFVEYIRACCDSLEEHDIEGLIEALTAQLKDCPADDTE